MVLSSTTLWALTFENPSTPPSSSFQSYSERCIFIFMFVPLLLREQYLNSGYFIFIQHPNKEEVRMIDKRLFFHMQIS